METHFHSRFSVNICCGIVGSQFIGPFVLEERLTSGRYLRLMEDDLPVLLDVRLHIRRELWLQQVGTPHFHSRVTAFLDQNFHSRWLCTAWPPALTPLDCFLWESMNFLVYAVESNTRAELLNRIMDAYAHTRNDKPSVTWSVASFSRRATVCIDNKRSHFQQILH